MEYIQPISCTGGKHTWFKNVLHFTDDDFEQFLAFTRDTHKDMLFCPVWSDIDANYSTVSSERESTAIVLLRLRSHQLFPEDLPNETLQSALRSRLYICRESWRDGQKRLRTKAAADTSSGQRGDPEELSEPAKGEHSRKHSALHNHSPRSLKIVLKLPNAREEMARLSAGQHVDYTGDTSHIGQPEASISTVLRSSADSQANPSSLNSTRPSTSESELRQLESHDNRNVIHTIYKLTDSSKKPTISLSAKDLAEDSEVSVAGRPSQHKSTSAKIDDGDTITVDVEGRKEMMLAEHSRKTSFMKRQRASSSSCNAKRRCMHDKRETEARPRLDKSTAPNKLANTFPHARPVPTTDIYPSLAQLVINNMNVPMPVASTVPEGYASWISDREEAGSDKQGPQHKEAMEPYSLAPGPNPALDWVLSQLQDLPTPPASNHPHSVDREVHAEPHCVHSVGDNDAVSARNTVTTRAEAAERDDSLRGDLRDAQAKVIQLEAKVKLLEEAQKPEALNIEVLSTELRLALENNDALRQDKLAQDLILASQRQETKQAVNRAHKLRLELENEQGLLKQSHARATTIQDKFESLERKHQSVNKSFGKAQVNLTSQAEEFQQLSASAQSQQHAIQILQAKVNVLQQTLDEERKRHQQSIHDLQEKTRSLEQSEQTAGESQTRILSLEESLSKSQVDLDAHKQEYKEERDRWHSHMNNLRSQKVAMRSGGLNSNANQSQTAISSAKQDAVKMAKENANLKAQVKEATSRAKRSENAVQKLASLYDVLILQHHTLSLEHKNIRGEGAITKEDLQLINKVIIRWQRFFADLVYVLFKLIEEDFSAARLRKIMREQGIDRKIVREIKAREEYWEPFVTTALQDRCMDDRETYLAKMNQHLPESSAEVLAQFEETGGEDVRHRHSHKLPGTM